MKINFHSKNNLKYKCIIVLFIIFKIFISKSILAQSTTISSEIYIFSDKISWLHSKIFFFGNVHIFNKEHQLKSNKIQLKYINKTRVLTAIGEIDYSNNFINIKGSHILYNLDSQKIEIYKAEYRFLKYSGKGTASIIEQSSKKNIMLKNNNFTSCSSEKKCWNIVGSKCLYNFNKNNINFYNALIHIGKIPLYYSPYITIPVEKNFSTNCIFPMFNYTNIKKLEYSLPCYLTFSFFDNIIITPIINYYGLFKIQSNFHYLNKFLGEGNIKYIWKNKKYTPIYKNNEMKNSWLKYKNILGKWIFYMDYNEKENNLSYKEHYAYYNFFNNNKKFLIFKYGSQIIQFPILNNYFSNIFQIKNEPTLNFLLNLKKGNIQTEYKLTNNTIFFKKLRKDKISYQIINQFLPKFEINSKIKFNVGKYTFYSNTMNYLFEPQIEYTYTPYLKNKNISNKFIYHNILKNIFINNKNYRINQFNGRLNFYIYNDLLIEKFFCSIGREYYIYNPYNNSFLLNWNSDFSWFINNNIHIRNNIIYNADYNYLANKTQLEYQINKNYILRINFNSYNKKNNSQNLLENIPSFTHTQKDIINSFSLYQKLNPNLNKMKLFNYLANLTYKSCCLEINLNYEKNIPRYRRHTNKLNNKIIWFSIKIPELYKINQLKSNNIFTSFIPLS
ncbi:LptA/OstA family protein [Candidatus Schneideria nysicola]|uniref:LptA/OstA family protein n=1 Tax=Candidatus Schneideria nysicola TaxID=1081631 RepID=UPI001CAA5D89|nr:LptA/OstA family protein [Candidatus Schneideria nysicola]UAJ66085.1 hypothetical protein KEC38_00110 [Candidatus Schneideria nysicola]